MADIQYFNYILFHLFRPFYRATVLNYKQRQIWSQNQRSRNSPIVAVCNCEPIK